MHTDTRGSVLVIRDLLVASSSRTGVTRSETAASSGLRYMRGSLRKSPRDPASVAQTLSHDTFRTAKGSGSDFLGDNRRSAASRVKHPAAPAEHRAEASGAKGKEHLRWRARCAQRGQRAMHCADEQGEQVRADRGSDHG